MLSQVADFMVIAIPQFCFGYPFIMAWYWMAGAALFYFTREVYMAPLGTPEPIQGWPPISILVPCYNEALNAEETLSTAAAVDYSEFEVIAINDGSRDNTAEVLNELATCIPRLRVVHLAPNQGKATALNVMERHRDPSTVEFRTLSFLRALFAEAQLPEPMECLYKVPAELERLLAMAYPAGDDRAGLRTIIEAAVDGDAMGVGARREGGTVRFEYPAVVLTGVKGA